MATPDEPKICPECHAPQLGDSPFCESCGYRLRSHETSVEGLPALTRQRLDAPDTRRPERVVTREERTLPRRSTRQTDQEPAVVPSAFLRPQQETVQEHAAISPELLARHAQAPPAAAADRERAPSNTILEGLPAIKAADAAPSEPRPAPRPATSPERPSAAASNEISALHAVPPAPQRPTRWLPMLLLGLMLGAIAGTTFTWLAATPQHDAQEGVSEPLADTKLSFNQTSFTQGLDEATRSRMLRTCYKLSDDSDKECAQEVLLQDEYPRATLEIAPFKLDANEVSNARYTQCVQAGACTEPDLKSCQVYTTQGLQISLRVPKTLLRPEHPVVCITHAQAEAFCAWSGGRLPSHGEWELAARGTRDARLFPWGDRWSPELANWGELDLTQTAIPGKLDGAEWTAPVGSFHEGVSPFGARDMAGNVAEWVARTSPDAPLQARGGSWISPPFDLRVTKRLSLTRDVARSDVGARCAY